MPLNDHGGLMLINFTVSNFKSIKDEIFFNMAPAKRLQTMKEHVLVVKTKKKAEAMPVGAIYGANGSGKSNFIEALAFMKERVHSDDSVAAIPFRLTYDAQEEQLFLREAVKRDVSLLQPVEEWFVTHLYIIRPSSRITALEVTLQRQPKALEKMNNQLRKMGMNLEKLETKEKKFNIDQYTSQLDEEESDHFRSNLEEMPEGEVIELSMKSYGRPQYVQKNSDGLYLITFEVCHERQDGKQVNFDISTASSGCMRMLDLLPAFDKAKTPDTLMLVDGMERDIHTLSSQYFIKQFIEIVTKDQNGSQLIFSTHDTNLLDSGLLRSDEIWFMEKDASSASQISSLSEFTLTTGLNYANGYLAGRFGAIPKVQGKD